YPVCPEQDLSPGQPSVEGRLQGEATAESAIRIGEHHVALLPAGGPTGDAGEPHAEQLELGGVGAGHLTAIYGADGRVTEGLEQGLKPAVIHGRRMGA